MSLILFEFMMMIWKSEEFVKIYELNFLNVNMLPEYFISDDDNDDVYHHLYERNSKKEYHHKK